MERSLYVVASAMVAELNRQERITSDLANVSTPGYKSEQSTIRSFDDMLLFSRMSGIDVGDAGLGVVATPPKLDLAQGPLRTTEEATDLALDGEGWFAVKTEAGTMYTRNGQFRVQPDGLLVTIDGKPVLSTEGDTIVLGKPSSFVVAPDGTVRSNGKTAGKLALATLADPRRAADGLYTGTVAGEPKGTFVRQGFLEGSGMNAAATMVDLIVSLRAFEAGQRVLKAADETLQRAISAGSVSGS